MKKTVAKMLPTIRAMAMITANSGLTLTPLVSSSKNLRSPAPWAGIRASACRFFFRSLIVIQLIQFREVLIKVTYLIPDEVNVRFCAQKI